MTENTRDKFERSPRKWRCPNSPDHMSFTLSWTATVTQEIHADGDAIEGEEVNHTEGSAANPTCTTCGVQAVWVGD